MKNKVLLTIILTIYILFPIIIFLNTSLYEIKFYILTVLGLMIFLIMKLFKLSNRDLGISKDNILSSVKRNALFVIACVVIIVICKILHINRYEPNETIYFYIFYILISCPLQEFLYRGVFGYFEKIMASKYLWLILSSFCYSFVHIIYKDILTCMLTFIIGIVWYLLYRKDYNLIGVSLSHIVLGILTISLGVIN